MSTNSNQTGGAPARNSGSQSPPPSAQKSPQIQQATTNQVQRPNGASQTGGPSQQQQQQQQQPQQRTTQSESSRTVIDYLNKTGYTRKDATDRLESAQIYTPLASQSNKPEGDSGENYPTGLNSYYKTALKPEHPNTSGPLSGPKYQPPDGGEYDPKSNKKTETQQQKNAKQKSPTQTQTQLQQLYNTHDRPYLALRDWTEKSLDLYKPELRRVLYPVFVHIYLDLIAKGCVRQAKDFFEENAADHATLHYQDLIILSSILLPAHLEENGLVKAFRNNKYVLKVSRTTFDLLLYFLHEIEDSGGSAIIRIINQYIEAKITTARPSRFSTEYVLDPEEGLPGFLTANSSSASAPSANGNNSGTGTGSGTGSSSTQNSDTFSAAQQQPIKLGKLPLDPEFEKDVEMEIGEQSKTNPREGDALIKEFHKMHEKEDDSPFRSALPLPRYKTADIQAEIQAIKDSRNRIALGNTQSALPSVCMYTFHNTHDDMNNLAFSNDSTLVAAGFSDSFIKLWSLQGKRLRSVLRDDDQNTDFSTSSLNGGGYGTHDTTDTSVLARRLVGHAGPVYGLSFSPDNRYLLSSSEDKTVRLWSTDTYTGLVSYKGHSAPVWDVAFGPFGHYFATASHDQTARLWSCDHIYPLRIFAGHLSDVDTVSFHPNSMYVVTGSSDKTCRLWDINRGNSVRVFVGHTAGINTTVVSPDGRWLASAGEDNVINVWDIGSGKRLKTMRGHGKSSIYSLAFSKEGSVLVSAGADCTVRVWDVRRGTGDQGPEPIETYVDPSLSESAGGGDSDLQNTDSKNGSSNSTSTSGGSSGNGTTSKTNGGNNGSSSSSTTSAANGNVNVNGGNNPDYESRKRREVNVTQDHLAVFNTKKTPVYKIQFTNRNLCIAGGAFMG